MKKIKVGFLPLYNKLYDDFSGPRLRKPMEAYMAQCVKELEANNISGSKRVCKGKRERETI